MEESGPPLPPPPGKDWPQFLEEYKKSGAQPAVDLTTLKAGDRVVVETKNTRYELTWQLDSTVELTTNRPNRPYGPVRIEGCVFGQAGAVMPGVLFCGGYLEYYSDRGHRRHRTTSISGLTLLRKEG